MTINRDNYEMYFLMYVDNELSAAEREAVELFAQDNHDLRQELDLLAGTTLPSEEMIFIPKTLLYKNATEVESVQESLLLHIDNELPAADVASLEGQIASNPQVKEEWELLQKTKLDPSDKVIFHDKRSLYRHTDNVVSIRFWRIAAAAILLGAGIFTGVSLYNNDSPSGEVAVSGETRKSDVAGQSPKKNDQAELAVTVRDTPLEKTPIEKNNVINNNVANADKKNKSADPLLNNINKDVRNQTAKQNVQPIEDKEIDYKPLVRNEKTVAQEDIAVVPPRMKEVNRPLIDTDITEVKNSFAKLASNDETSEDRILYMDEDKVTRSKLGGLFRKVKRVVERNTKIKTSNGLRIGGFEFALK